MPAKIRSQSAPPSYASAGSGSLQHLVTEQFKKITGSRMVHVPYKGGGDAVRSVLTGETLLFFAGLPPAMPHVKSGKLRALAVTTKDRFPATPDIPTMAEAGFPDIDAGNWFGLMAPRGTPRDIIASINSAVNSALRQPDVIKGLINSGALPSGSTPEAFQKLVEDEEKRWAVLVKELELKID